MNIPTQRHPYYDDFNESKQFHRVLFKPGFGVQGRELTQLQTILQNQIERFGKHVFKDGSVVRGCAISYNFEFPFVKILDTDALAEELDNDFIESLVGESIRGLITGVTATIKKAVGGSEASLPNLKTFYVQYTSSGLDNETTRFQEDETLVLESDEDVTFIVGGVETEPLGVGSLFSIGDGTVFAKGFFISNSEQTIVLSPYDTSPSCVVGFTVNEEIIDSDDDPSLLEPAQGSYNETAPGADRYKLTTELAFFGLEETQDDGFYLLAEIEDGEIRRRFDRTQYEDLGKELARRTYDESGDYTVRPFGLVVREHLKTDVNNGRYTEEEGGDASKLVVGVEPGKAYVRGFEHELLATQYIEIDKAVDTAVLENQPISTSYGNYLLIDTVVGPWTINTGLLVTLTDDMDATIGTARVRDLQYHSGDIGVDAVYRLYLYDIVLTGLAADIAKVFNDAAEVAAVVETFQNTKYQSLVFQIPATAVKTVGDASFVYRKQITGVAVADGGTFSINLTGETWAFSAVDDLTVDREILVIAEEDFTGGTLTHSENDIIDVAGGVTYVSGTQLNFDLSGTTTGNPTVTVIVNVRKSVSVPNTKTLRENRCVKIDTGTHDNTDTGWYSLGFSDVYRIDGIWIADNSETYPNIDLAVEDPDAGTWEDVLDSFVLRTGETDGMYGLSYIETVPGSALDLTDKKIIIKLAYFEHGGSSGFYSVASYPLPAENEAAASGEIEWWEIPQYESAAGVQIDLRNALDFRSTVVRVSNDKTLVNSGTPEDDGSENPEEYDADTMVFESPILTPVATEEFVGDVTHHLGRIDRVVLDAEGTFFVVRGVPSTAPVRPAQPSNTMTIGYETIPPYPSLSPYVAKLENRLEYSTVTTLVDNRRFTMRDIGNIHKRIERLEYYTSLSLLEQNAEGLLIINDDGENRFKNGILVDSFIGHNIGNVRSTEYNCSIADGVLRPAFSTRDIALGVSGLAGTVRSPDDAYVVVRVVQNTTAFEDGELVTTDGAGGEVNHVVFLGENDSYLWYRLYLNNVSGTFVAGGVVLGVESGAEGVITYDGITEEAVEPVFRPELVVVPEDGDLISLPYTHLPITGNPYASKTRNCVSAMLFTYDGTLELSPAVDTWVDTAVRPEIQNNPEGLYDNWEIIVQPYRTSYGTWNRLTQSPAFSFNEHLNGGFLSPYVIGASYNRITEYVTVTKQIIKEQPTTTPTEYAFNLIPYMRQVVIGFSGTRMKPNTRVYAYFDGRNVSEHCKLSTSTTYGTALVVDDDGNISGQFRVPAGAFTIGTKMFILVDNSLTVEGDSSTIAMANFTASGLSVYEQRTIQSTQPPVPSTPTPTKPYVPSKKPTNPPLNTKTIAPNALPQLQGLVRVYPSCTVSDPIAQTFFITDHPNGVFVSKLDVYFRTRSSTEPITLELREILNGYPTNVIVPFSRITLTPDEINVSEDASAPTEFRFPSPVHLKNDTEYGFVLIPGGSNDEYNLWVSELGQNQIGTTERIDKQPNAGILFISSNNSTWTGIQSEDIKFTLYRAVFETDTAGTATLKNKTIDYLTLDTDDVSVGDDIVSGTGTGVILHFDPATNQATVLVTDGYFEVGAADIADIVSVDSITAHEVVPILSHFHLNGSAIEWDYKIRNVAGTQMSSFESLSDQGATLFTEEKKVFSTTTHASSLLVRATLESSIDAISPIVDISKAAVLLIENDVNDDASDEETNAGAASSKYVARKTVLEDGQEAEDVRVYTTEHLPGGTSVKVYAKLLADIDPTPFDDRAWVELDKSVSVNAGDFVEYVYTIPAGDPNSSGGGRSVDTGFEGVYQYTQNGIYYGFKTFAIKIVLLSSNPVNVPVLRDMRVIALQV